jgi:hypothetical protein
VATLELGVEIAGRSRSFFEFVSAALVSGGALEMTGQWRLTGGRRHGERGAPFVLAAGAPGAHVCAPTALFALKQATQIVREERARVEHKDSNRRGAGRLVEVCMRVTGADHPLLLVDDLDLCATNRLADMLGRCGLAVVETSPGNFQVSVLADRPLNADQRAAAQRALARRLGGDPAAIGGAQLRRIPGSVNAKPALGDLFVSRLHGEVMRGEMPPQLLAALLEEGDISRALWKPTTGIDPVASSAVASIRSARLAGLSACITLPPARYPGRDVKHKVDSSASAEEWRWLRAQLLLPGGGSEESVANLQAQLERVAAARGKPRAAAYAARTVKKALSTLTEPTAAVDTN